MTRHRIVALQEDGGALRGRLKNIFDNRSIVAAGSVQLVGVEDIRNRIGDRWNAVREKVHVFIQRIIRNLLTPHDAWFRYGDDDYVLVFARLDKTAAQLLCGRLIEDIHRSLLGREDAGEIVVRTVVFDIDGKLAIEMAGLSDVLEEAAQHRSGKSPDDRDAENKNPAAGGDENDEAWDDDDGEDDPDHSFSDRLAALRNAVRNHTQKSRPHVVFRPVWDVAKSVVSTYRCVPAQGDDLYHAVSGYDVLSDPADDAAIFALDCETFTQSIMIALEMNENKFKYISCIPLHFESLATSRRRNDYLKLLNLVPKGMTTFIEFIVYGLPVGAPAVRLTEIKTLLSPHSRLVIPMIHYEERNFSAVSQAGMRLVGFRIPAAATESEALERLHSFALSARKYSLVTYVGGVRSEAIFDAACREGVRFLSGPYIAPDEDYPQHMRRILSREIRLSAEARRKRT